MQRLTFEGNFCDIARCPSDYIEGCTCDTRKMWERLKQYEDTGLSPEEIIKLRGELITLYDNNQEPYLVDATGSEAKHIVELLQAEAEGRLVVLPCKELFEKIGDDVYVIDDGEVVEALLCMVGLDHTGTDYIEVLYGKSQEDERGYSLRFADVGKTVFLTLEDAEVVLKKNPCTYELQHHYNELGDMKSSANFTASG